MKLSRWWLNDPKEIYWLEVTDRKDLGRDLNAPQFRDDNNEYYGYSLIKEVSDNDIVFHYHKRKKAIVAVSRICGNVYEDTVLWAAHGTTARGGNIQPYLRPGWRRGIIDFKQIDEPITLKQIRMAEDKIRQVRHDLETKYGDSLYFPFELSPKRELRPGQAYLTKLPKNIIGSIAALQSALFNWQQSIEKAFIINGSSDTSKLGVPYRLADEEAAVSEYEPFRVDPALAERARRSHASAQNTLATYLEAKGIEPRSPQPGEPNFDLAWVQDETIFVAEIKSLTPVNEEAQLRLGLGQVLRYKYFLAHIYKTMKIRAVLMLEREPFDQSWIGCCRDLGILLIWPAIVADYF